MTKVEKRSLDILVNKVLPEKDSISPMELYNEFAETYSVSKSDAVVYVRKGLRKLRDKGVAKSIQHGVWKRVM